MLENSPNGTGWDSVLVTECSDRDVLEHKAFFVQECVAESKGEFLWR